MNQNELNRAVARATGESVDYIRAMGFSLHVVPARRQYRPPSIQARPALRAIRRTPGKVLRAAA